MLRLSISGETIQSRLSSVHGVTSGWDYLRISLAVCVLAIHSGLSSYGTAAATEMWRSPFRAPMVAVLPMFFALSGFLVSGSVIRSKTILEFILLRALRIVPALLVEILLSALVLGPLFTMRPLAVYFSGHEFWQYLLNVIGWIHYFLPGVFAANPFPGVVNSSLWTIPFELECYLALVVFALFGLIRRRNVFLFLVVVLNIALAVAFYLQYEDVYGERSPGRLLVVAFLAGVIIYLWRDRIVLNFKCFFAASAASLALLTWPETEFLAAFPIAYVTVYLGLTSPPKNWFLMTGDYSYGLYLFAFPIQQSYTFLFPAGRYWWANSTFALALGLLYAAFSWHVIEKRVLARKKNIISYVESRLGRPRNLLFANRARAITPAQTPTSRGHGGR